MIEENLEVRAQKSNYMFGIELIFLDRGLDNKVRSIGELTMKECPIGGLLPEGSRIPLSDTAAQVLMDELWNCGVRPTEGTGSAGSLKATENHLEDMRDIAKKSVDLLLEHARRPQH